MGNPSQSYRASLAVWDHTVLPATRHKWTRPALTPARQAGTRFTYPGGMEGWVDLGSLIAARPGFEPTTAWSQVRRPNHYATKPPRKELSLYLYFTTSLVISNPFAVVIRNELRSLKLELNLPATFLSVLYCIVQCCICFSYHSQHFL